MKLLIELSDSRYHQVKNGFVTLDLLEVLVDAVKKSEKYEEAKYKVGDLIVNPKIDLLDYFTIEYVKADVARITGIKR